MANEDDEESNKDEGDTNTQCSNDPFVLIERGNALEDSQNHWAASDFFSQASNVLERLALDHDNRVALRRSRSGGRGASVDDDCTDVAGHNNQDEKIARLYRDQSLEYLCRARTSLIRALEFEKEEDLRRGGFGKDSPADQLSSRPLMDLLGVSDIERRKNIFARIFAPMPPSSGECAGDKIKKNIAIQTDHSGGAEGHLNNGSNVECYKLPPVNTPTTEGQNGQAKGHERAEKSIEERLALLNSSLPPPPKTEKQRMDDIHNGLNKLGVYVPSSSDDNHAKGLDALGMKEISEEEQILEIMAMAKDEVSLLVKEDIHQDKNDSDGNPSSSNVPEYETAEELLQKAGIQINLSHEDNSNGSSKEEKLRDIVSKTKKDIVQLETGSGADNKDMNKNLSDDGEEETCSSGEIHDDPEGLLQKVGIQINLPQSKSNGEGESESDSDGNNEDNSDGDSDSSTSTVTSKDFKIAKPSSSTSTSTSTSTSQLLSRTQQLLSQASTFLEKEQQNTKSDESKRTAITGSQLKQLCNNNESEEALDMKQASIQKHAVLLKEIKHNFDKIISSWPNDSSPINISTGNSK